MSESLRDQLAANYDKIVTAEEPAQETTTPAPVEAEPAPAAETKPAAEAKPASDARERDDKGRFVEKKEEPQKAESSQQSLKLEPAKPAKHRPSAWKKDHWEAYDKIAAENPALADYILQREGEFARGVSTYKQEWDRAKPLLDAIAPFSPMLNQHGIQPAQWISNLGNAHQRLVMGSPQEKISLFAKLAQDYGVDLRSLIQTDANGQMQMQIPPQPQMSAQDVENIVRASLNRAESERADAQAKSEISNFAEQKEKYPHFDEVRETMAGLLQAGLADGLDAAYQAALRHPMHDNLFQQVQEQQRLANEAAASEERRKAAESARRKAASPRTTTPTSAAMAGNAKGLRATIESAFEDHVAGRV